jgi:hypothetical protein
MAILFAAVQPTSPLVSSVQRVGERSSTTKEPDTPVPKDTAPNNVDAPKKRTRLAVWQKKAKAFWKKWRKQIVLGSVVAGAGLGTIAFSVVAKHQQNLMAPITHETDLPESGKVLEGLMGLIALLKNAYKGNFTIDNKQSVNNEVVGLAQSMLRGRELRPKIAPEHLETMIDTAVQQILDYCCLIESDLLPSLIPQLYSNKMLANKLTDSTFSKADLSHQAIPNSLTHIKDYLANLTGKDAKDTHTIFKSYYQLHEALTLLLRYESPKEAKNLLVQHGPELFRKSRQNILKPLSGAEALAELEVYATYFRALEGNRAKNTLAIQRFAQKALPFLNTPNSAHLLEEPPTRLTPELVRTLSIQMGIQLDEPLAVQGSNPAQLMAQVRSILRKAVHRSSPTNAMDSMTLGDVSTQQFASLAEDIKLTGEHKEKSMAPHMDSLDLYLKQNIKAIVEDRLLLKPDEMIAIFQTLQEIRPTVQQAIPSTRARQALHSTLEKQDPVQLYRTLLTDLTDVQKQADASTPTRPVTTLTDKNKVLRQATKTPGLREINRAFAAALNDWCSLVSQPTSFIKMKPTPLPDAG